MSAKRARATSTGTARQQDLEPVMSKSKKAPHLAAVEAAADSASPRAARRGHARHTIPELERYATLLRIDCVRMLAVAKSGHLDSSLSAADIVAALYYRVLRHDPRPAALARPGPLRALQGPRRPDPVRGAGPARLLPERGPDEAAQARRASPGPPGHDPHARDRGLDRIPGPGPLDERRDRPRAAPGRHRRGPCVRAALGRRLPGGPDVGGRDRRGPLPRHEPDRDRRLQPPSDRRHHRGSDGHR